MSWSVVRRAYPDSWLDLILGREWADRIVYHEEHHQEDDVGTELLRGRVASIWEVRCRRVLQAQGAGEVMVPVAGSGQLTEVDRADPWASDSRHHEQDPITFDGWVVEVDVAED